MTGFYDILSLDKFLMIRRVDGLVFVEAWGKGVLGNKFCSTRFMPGVRLFW